jgi:amino acid transporter
MLPLSVAIIVLLGIVFFSYLQTIAAYPQGGGSYTVAHQNLGIFPGLLAAALLIDYTLDAAVGISAGIGALTSAFPKWHGHTLRLDLID